GAIRSGQAVHLSCRQNAHVPAPRIFLALRRRSLLAIPAPPNYAGKTAAESGSTRTAIVTPRDGAARRARTARHRAIGSLDGKGAASGRGLETKRSRGRRRPVERCRLGQDFQAWLETAELLQISRDRILPDDVGPELRESR